MLAPIIKKLNLSKQVLIERTLPVDGEITAKIGEQVRPFDRLGECAFSHRSLVLPKNFMPDKTLVSKNVKRLL